MCHSAPIVHPPKHYPAGVARERQCACSGGAASAVGPGCPLQAGCAGRPFSLLLPLHSHLALSDLLGPFTCCAGHSAAGTAFKYLSGRMLSNPFVPLYTGCKGQSVCLSLAWHSQNVFSCWSLTLFCDVCITACYDICVSGGIEPLNIHIYTDTHTCVKSNRHCCSCNVVGAGTGTCHRLLADCMAVLLHASVCQWATMLVCQAFC